MLLYLHVVGRYLGDVPAARCIEFEAHWHITMLRLALEVKVIVFWVPTKFYICQGDYLLKARIFGVSM